MFTHYNIISFCYIATLCVQTRSLLSLGVRLYVCLSRHVGVLYPHGRRYRQTSFLARQRHHSRFLTMQRRYPSPRGIPSEGDKYTAVGKVAIFDLSWKGEFE